MHDVWRNGIFWRIMEKIQIKILEMKIATLGKKHISPKDIKRRLSAAGKIKNKKIEVALVDIQLMCRKENNFFQFIF